MVHPDSDRIPRAPPYSGAVREIPTFRLRGFHPLWRTFPSPSSRQKFCNSPECFKTFLNCPTTPVMQRLESWHIKGLGFSAFARRYLRNRFCFLFLRLLRCFTSPHSPLYAMDSRISEILLRIPGSPIRKSAGHWLFAPDRGLSQLATSFIACYDQGIRPVLLVT